MELAQQANPEGGSAWGRWPLCELASLRRDAWGVSLPASTPLPTSIADKINGCSASSESICIAWEASTYVVVEFIDPITEDEEKSDIQKRGSDWQRHLAQSFDILPVIDCGDVADDDLDKWYESLRVSATRKARSKFGSEDRPKHSIFLSEDTSNVYPASVLFSVGGLRNELARANREMVLAWADSVYKPLLDERLLALAQMAGKRGNETMRTTG